MKKMSAILVILVAMMLVVAALTAAVMLNSGAKGAKDLIITYSNKVDYEPLIIANENGLYAKHGLNVTALVVTGGIQSAEAIMTGAADLGAMGDAPAIQLLAQSPGAKIVARYAYGEGMHRLIAYTDIVLPTDLEGKKVGMQMGSSSQGAFLQWAGKNGVDVDSLTMVPLSPSDMADAMKTRQVDAVMASEPFPIKVLAKCGSSVHELGNSSGLGNIYPLVLVASENALQNKREAVNAALEAIEEAVGTIHGDYAGMAALCANRTGLTAEQQIQAMSDLTYGLGFNAQDLAGLNLTAHFLLDSGKIASVPDFQGRTDSNYWTKD